MAMSHSPKIVTDGLVFYYDMANKEKSWLGAPTTNIRAGSNLSAFGGNTPIINNSYNLTINNSGGWSSITSIGSNTNYRLAQFLYNTLTANLNYTFSLELFNPGPNTLCIFIDGNSDYSYTNIPTGYSRWSFTVNRSTSGVQAIFFGSQNQQTSVTYTPPRIIYFKNYQVEQNSFATPYVNGTRSNTQSIIDLTGNNTITTNSLTYNSDNTFSFNGSSDFLRPNINHDYKLSSCLEVVFRSNSHGSGYKTIFGYRHNGGYSLPTIGSIYLNGNTLSATVITASQVYRTVSSSISINTNQTFHVCLNKDTVNGTLNIFVNGQLTGTQTFDAATYGQWTTAGSFIGDNILDIGKSSNNNSGQGWSTDFFNGSIYIAKVYNRTLSSAEIQQNFNALRGRYGI